MPSMNQYPRRVADVIDENATYCADALRAVRELKKSKPWRGTTRERTAKFDRCLRSLCAAYGLDMVRLAVRGIGTARSNGMFCREANTITLVGKLSVVTFLHEFAHARGMKERGACRWSVNLFKRVFPKQYEKLRSVGHILVTDSRAQTRRRIARLAGATSALTPEIARDMVARGLGHLLGR